MQHAVNALWRYVLFFFNFKSNHVVLCSDAVGNNVWFHAAAFVVIGFNILLVFGPTLHGHIVNMIHPVYLYTKIQSRLYMNAQKNSNKDKIDGAQAAKVM